MYKVLTIAGSDSSGGAGIQADLKTMTALKVYGMSVITALTAQNTCGVISIFDVDKDFVMDQLDAVFTDIFPDSIKIGMVSNKEVILAIAEKLKEYKAKNIVLDPVMVSTSGSKLLKDDAKEALITKLMPLSTIITPNIPEAEVLSNIKIKNKEDMITAAKIISKSYNGHILLKGGHSTTDSDDLLFSSKNYEWIKGEKINNPNTHGTGCTLSSAIASYIAMGNTINNSVLKAKQYVTGAIRANLNLGRGRGPLNHMWHLNNSFQNDD